MTGGSRLRPEAALTAELERLGRFLVKHGGTRPSAADVAAGVQAAVATRVAALAGRDVDTPIVFTGGVALIPGMADALETALDRPVGVAPTPLMTGALGAAILAARQAV